MKTQRLQPDEKGIAEAIRILKGGGIVAVPTETVYGLAASAYDDEAIRKVFEAKGRPQDNPLIVHIANETMLRTVVREVPAAAEKCAAAFWPGPLTMVLKKSGAVCNRVCAGLDTVAVRMPSQPTVLQIIREGNLPLAAPSANLSGAPSPTTATDVLADMDGRIDAVMMGEECRYGVESTVLSLFEEQPRILRPGAVTPEQLSKILPGLIIDPAVLSEPAKNAKVASPGMKYKHYAPKAEMILVEGSVEAFCAYVNRQEDGAAICFEEDRPHLTGPALVYGRQSDPLSLAHNLFSVLRKTDRLGIQKGYVHAPEKNGVGLAVYNRVIRSCAFRVVKV